MIATISKRIAKLLEDTRKILRLFAVGAFLFFIGLGIIQGADRMMVPSLRQESYVLMGLVIGGAGFFIAMFAQVLLIVQRFRNLGN